MMDRLFPELPRRGRSRTYRKAYSHVRSLAVGCLPAMPSHSEGSYPGQTREEQKQTGWFRNAPWCLAPRRDREKKQVRRGPGYPHTVAGIDTDAKRVKHQFIVKSEFKL